MTSKLTFVLVVVIGCLLCGLKIVAQEKGEAVARRELQLGEKIRLTGDSEAALKHFRAAVDAAPDLLEAHEAFAAATEGAEVARLRKEAQERHDQAAFAAAPTEGRRRVAELYEQWAKEHLGKVLYRYFAALYREEAGPSIAQEAEYKKMTETDPGFAPPYARLADIAVWKGDEARFREYTRKASELRPDSFLYRLLYMDSFLKTDPAAYLKLADDYARRFPDNSATWRVLQLAAACAPTREVKIAYLQRTLDASTPPRRPRALEELCLAYAETDPATAAEITTKELEAARAKTPSDRFAISSLEKLAAYFTPFAKARQLLADGKADDAAAVGLKIQPPGKPTAVFARFLLAQLKSDILSAQGKPRDAYDVLVAEAGPAPSARLLNAIEPLALKIGKGPAQTRADILKAALAKAQPLKDFELPDLAGGKKNTADYRGKILYLNLWAPS